MVVIVGDRKEPSGSEPSQAEKVAWFDSALAYAGTYTLEDNQVTHHLEASVNPLRAAGKLVRSVRLDGRVVTLTGAPFHYTAERIGVVTLVWERIE